MRNYDVSYVSCISHLLKFVTEYGDIQVIW